MTEYKAGAIFLGPYDGVYVLTSKTKTIWSAWCSKVNNTENNGIIEAWRNEEQIDELIQNGILTPLVDADGNQE